MENNQPIIIKRVKRIAGGHHGGAWKIAFADFATAMMAFFLVLWLLSTATPEQKIAIAGYFKDPVGFSESGTPYIIDLGGSPTLAPENTLNPEVKSQPQPDKVTIDAEQVEGMAEQVEKERLELLLQELQTKVEENPQLQEIQRPDQFRNHAGRFAHPDRGRRKPADVRLWQCSSEAVLRRHPAGHGRHH